MARELKEELNLSINKDELINLGERKQISIIKEKQLISREIIRIFLLELKLPKFVKPDKDEISEIIFFDSKELRDMISRKPELFVDDKDYFFDTIVKIEAFFDSKYRA